MQGEVDKGSEGEVYVEDYCEDQKRGLAGKRRAEGSTESRLRAGLSLCHT